MNKSILLAICLTISGVIYAQASETLKFGHINKQEVFSLMPEAENALKELESLLLNYKMEGKKLEEEFTKKQQDFVANQEKMDTTIRRYRETELQRLYLSIEEFSKKADEALKKRQEDLLAPIEKKINDAITKVGEEQGFIYIFDVTTPGTFAYRSAKSIDVLPLVKNKLGLK